MPGDLTILVMSGLPPHQPDSVPPEGRVQWEGSQRPVEPGRVGPEEIPARRRPRRLRPGTALLCPGPGERAWLWGRCRQRPRGPGWLAPGSSQKHSRNPMTSTCQENGLGVAVETGTRGDQSLRHGSKVQGKKTQAKSKQTRNPQTQSSAFVDLNIYQCCPGSRLPTNQKALHPCAVLGSLLWPSPSLCCTGHLCVQ